MANALAWTARGLTLDAACIDAETLPVPIDESHIERACGVSTIDAALIDGETTDLMLDAARIDFDSSGLTVDAACIDRDGDVLAWTARGLAIDAACIDAETFACPIDESHTERPCGDSTIDAARIDAKTLPVPINVVAQPPVTITSVVPPAGIMIGGKKVTIRGTNFQNGATFGGSLATNVVFVTTRS